MSLTQIPLKKTAGGSRSCSSNPASPCSVCAKPLVNVPETDSPLYIPNHLILETTNQCNLDCIMCERRLEQPDDLMTREIFDACIERLAHGYVAIEVSGLGEPTLCQDFPYHATAIYNEGKVLYFPTNGYGISKSHILDSLKDSDNTRVSFSLDAATAETYGRVRPDKKGRPGDFNLVVKNVRNFKRAKPNARLQVAFVGAGYNIDEFPDVVRLAIDLGATNTNFSWVRCWAISPEEHSLRFRQDQTLRAWDAARTIAQAANHPLNIEQFSFADGHENSGTIAPGFISYLDILPLDQGNCGSGGSGTTGSCVVLDTMIKTLNGEKLACDLTQNDIVIGENNAEQRVQRVHERTVQPCIEIRSNDLSIRCSDSHPLIGDRSVGNEGWRRADSFLVGDQIQTERGLQRVDALRDIGQHVVVNWNILPNHVYWANGFLSHNTKSGTTVGPSSIGEPDIEPFPGVTRSPQRSNKLRPIIVTDNVTQVLTDGTITTCGAKHVLGHVSRDTFESIVNHPDYQAHLWARHNGQPNMSKFCSSCEKMW